MVEEVSMKVGLSMKYGRGVSMKVGLSRENGRGGRHEGWFEQGRW